MRHVWLTVGVGASLLCACVGAGAPAGMLAGGSAPCRAEPLRVASLPGVTASHGDLASWANALPEGAADRVLMDASEIASLNGRNRDDAWGFQDVLSSQISAADRVDREISERFVWLEERLKTGKYQESQSGMLAVARALSDQSERVVQARLVAVESDLRCIPSAGGLFTAPVDVDFDRNQCSRLHVGETVRVLRQSQDGRWRYVHAGHSVGWLEGEVLTPPLLVEEVQAFRSPVRQAVITGDGPTLSNGTPLRMGARLPIRAQSAAAFEVIVPTVGGLVVATLPAGDDVHDGLVPFTRRSVWRLSLATLGAPYGWGGRGGARDCSRLLLDLFRVFGIELGRHSLAQARGGAKTVELAGLDVEAKRSAIREAGRDNVVLLYMSGHIMLYLGERDGSQYAVSAISEFLSPCDGVGDQVSRIDRTVVSDLRVGRATERTSFIERMKRLAVFGR
jgi:hypothetical protein